MSTTDEFVKANIVPGVVDALDLDPNIQINFSFGSTPVSQGQHVPAHETHETPTITITGADKDALYTLICDDPDAPDPAAPMGEVLHWVVTNISGGDIKTGTEDLNYRGAGPRAGTHRYLFFLYKQSGPVTFKDPTEGKRYFAKLREVAASHELGNPVAVFYFLSSKVQQ